VISRPSRIDTPELISVPSVRVNRDTARPRVGTRLPRHACFLFEQGRPGGNRRFLSALRAGEHTRKSGQISIAFLP
jgi:hypothetical protein